MGDLQLPVSPVPVDLMFSSSLCGHFIYAVHMQQADTHRVGKMREKWNVKKGDISWEMTPEIETFIHLGVHLTTFKQTSYHLHTHK